MLKILIAALAAPALAAIALTAVAQASSAQPPAGTPATPVLADFSLDAPHPIGR